jgi:drug/metabolite transporter (DMT)-like permease
MMNVEERRGLLLVALAVGFLSTSPVLVGWAEPMDPIVKTWGRLTVAALAVWLALLVVRGRHATNTELKITPSSEGQDRNAKGPQPVLRFIAYGFIAALHFLTYVASLSFTTAAHSLAIVYTAPIFVTLLSGLFLGERIRRGQWLGGGVTVVGIGILAGLEPTMSWGMALGDGLALVSAITYGFYSVAGRYERERYPLLVYASRVYGIAALWLLPLALVVIPGMPAEAWGWEQVGSVVALGLIPLALGHTMYNAALRRVHATYANVIASQEVTGGVMLSWLLLGQVPSVNSLVGAAVALVGVAVVLREA